MITIKPSKCCARRVRISFGNDKGDCLSTNEALIAANKLMAVSMEIVITQFQNEKRKVKIK